MSCHEIQPELVAYHFGIVSDETRRGLEVHLASCPACLGAFLAVKRDIETAESGPRPSPAARERLRLAVARELGVGEPRQRWSWWERPLAFGLAGVAVIAALLLLSVLSAAGGSMPRSLLEGSPRSAAPLRSPGP